jgi:probable phosphoglycerate mutase
VDTALTTFLLIRHAMTDAVGRYLAGRRAGVHLNGVGRRQAATLAERLSDLRIDAIVSSPLERATETAAPLAAAHHREVHVLPELTEFDVGEWTGATFDALASDSAWQRFNTERSTMRPPGGETMADVQQRVVDALLALEEQHQSATVAVISHGDVIRAALLKALGMPLDLFDRIEVMPARVSVLSIGAGAPKVLQINGDTVPPRG